MERKSPAVLSLPGLFIMAALAAAMILLALLGRDSDYRDVSVRVVESPEGLEILGSGQAGSSLERDLLRRTREAHGRPGLSALVRIEHRWQRDGLRLGLAGGNRGPLWLYERGFSRDLSMRFSASIGGSRIVYTTGQPISEAGHPGLPAGQLPPELAQRLGLEPVEDLDAAAEVRRIWEAVAEFARLSDQFGLQDAAPLIEAGGGREEVRDEHAVLRLGAVWAGMTLLLLMPLLVLRAATREPAVAADDEHRFLRQ